MAARSALSCSIRRKCCSLPLDPISCGSGSRRVKLITNPLKSNTRKYFEFAALCLLAVVIIWWFGRKLDWTEVRLSVSHANPYLLGLAVLMISSELPEVIGVSDRIVVMREGRIAVTLDAREATEERVMAHATKVAA